MCENVNIVSVIVSVGVAARIADWIESSRDSWDPGLFGSSIRLPVIAVPRRLADAVLEREVD